MVDTHAGPPTPAELPPPLARLLDGSDLRTKIGETLLLLTTDERGFPHLALLSVGEVYAPTSGELRFALWRGTRTSANLTRSGKAVLAVILDGAGHYVELEARPAGEIELPTIRLARFDATVRDVRVDTVGYAVLEAGIRFRLKDADKVIGRWEAQVAALRR